LCFANADLLFSQLSLPFPYYLLTWWYQLRHGSLVGDPPRERIKNAPEYDPTAIIDRGYEERLYDYHQKKKYWTEPLL
jgi:hypothetical protein